MLTCKIGNSVVNCFNSKYDRYTFKKWSERNLLKCPDCGGIYEYCHGDIQIPYFRHKEKSRMCVGGYSEAETEEHINGKIKLYEWLINLQDNNIIENVKLEYYISETKQRPDLYFEQNGKKYVI